MAHHDIDTILGWRGKTVRDAEGEKIGTFGDVLLDRETDLPAWAGVRTGLFGRRESYVPLEGAREVEGDVRLPYAKQLVDDAPNIDPDTAPTAEEEERLHAHYGMLRSEEEPEVAKTEMRPAERVRLKKVLVTEHRTQKVPVQREVVALEGDAPEGAQPVEPPDDRPPAGGQGHA